MALDNTEKECGIAAARKTYSEQELAEVYLTAPDDFVGIDLEEATLNWNPNYIYTFLKHIENIEKIDEVIEWMIAFWEEKKGMYDSFEKKLSFVESHAMFKETLRDIRNSVAEWLDKKKKKMLLKEKMLNGYIHRTATIGSNHTILAEETKTSVPVFNPSMQHNPDGDTVNYQIKIDDLPNNIRNKVVVSQKVFDVFVKQLNEDLWLTVVKKKTKYCGCLFFLSNFYYITSRNMDAKEFALLLQHIVLSLKGEGSVESSIRRRDETKEANIDRSYKCYACADINKSMEQEIFKLRNDCKQLLDGFQPVLDAMKAEKEAAEKHNNQTLQASSAV